MSVRMISVAALAAAAGLVAASAAQAAEQFNQNLASPGVYFGTGNGTLPQEFTTDTEGGIEIGLRSKISGIHPQVVPIDNIYQIPIGSTFNFDYSFNPDVGGSEADLTGLVQSIHITDAFGLSVSFDPSSSLLGNVVLGNGPGQSPLAPVGGFQNSEKISFFFLDPGYNPNQNDTFHITYTVTSANGAPLLAVDNVVNVGTGVPEPAAWALMILGFGGAGAALRRRRQAVVAA